MARLVIGFLNRLVEPNRTDPPCLLEWSGIGPHKIPCGYEINDTEYAQVITATLFPQLFSEEDGVNVQSGWRPRLYLLLLRGEAVQHPGLHGMMHGKSCFSVRQLSYSNRSCLVTQHRKYQHLFSSSFLHTRRNHLSYNLSGLMRAVFLIYLGYG